MAFFLSSPNLSVFPSEAVKPQGVLVRFLKFVDTRQDLGPHEIANCTLNAAFFAMLQITRIDVRESALK